MKQLELKFTSPNGLREEWGRLLVLKRLLVEAIDNNLADNAALFARQCKEQSAIVMSLVTKGKKLC